MVYRMVSKDTIEEKVMALKATKAQLFESVMTDGAVSGREAQRGGHPRAAGVTPALVSRANRGDDAASLRTPA